MKFLILVLTAVLGFTAHAATETKEFDSAQLDEVELTNLSGKISVIAVDAPKATITATKIKFAEACNMIIDKIGDKLVVKVEKESKALN